MLQAYGALTVNGEVVEIPPPGAGVDTETSALPAEAKSAAGISAINCLALRYAVATGTEFQRTVELNTNPEPFTSTSKSAAPAVALEGVSVPIAGLGASGPVMAKSTEGDAFNSPGSLTEMLAMPAAARSVAAG